MEVRLFFSSFFLNFTVGTGFYSLENTCKNYKKLNTCKIYKKLKSKKRKKKCVKNSQCVKSETRALQ